MHVRFLLPVAGVLALVCMAHGRGSPKDKAAAPAGQVTIVSSFAGDTSNCPLTNYEKCGDRPDPAIAVGPAHVVLYNIQGLTVYNKDGSLFQAKTRPSAFWAAAGIQGITKPTDPHAAYDIFTHRYLVTQTIAPQPNCGDLLAVSAADDPTKWKAINVSGHCGDFNMWVGYDKNGVYMCEYDPASSPPGSICAAIPAADTQWSGEGNIITKHLVVVTTSSGTVGDGRYGPAININPSIGLSDPMVLVSRPAGNVVPGGIPLVLNYRKWTWTDPNTPVLSGGKTISTKYTYYMGAIQTAPHSMTVQPGSAAPYLRGSEGGRNIQPVIDLSGNMWLTMASEIGSQLGNLGFYWFKIPVSSMKIAASGVVYDNVGSSAITYGTAAVDSKGNAYFFYLQGSASEYWSHYVRVVPAGSSTTSSATLLKAGGPNPITSTHTWSNTAANGTYAAQSIDASDQTKVWFYGQYANNPAPNIWVTWVSEVTY